MRTIDGVFLAIDEVTLSSSLTTTVSTCCGAGFGFSGVGAGVTVCTVRSTIWFTVLVNSTGACMRSDVVMMPAAIETTNEMRMQRRMIWYLFRSSIYELYTNPLIDANDYELTAHLHLFYRFLQSVESEV